MKTSSLRFTITQMLFTTLIASVSLGCLADSDPENSMRTFGFSHNTAKHIILFVGDGMNIEHEIAASRYLYGKDFELSFHKLPYKGNVATWDVTTYNYWADPTRLNRPPYTPGAIEPIVGYDPLKGGKRPYPLGPELPGAQAYHMAKATDSASAATAWATGCCARRKVMPSAW